MEVVRTETQIRVMVPRAWIYYSVEITQLSAIEIYTIIGHLQILCNKLNELFDAYEDFGDIGIHLLEGTREVAYLTAHVTPSRTPRIDITNDFAFKVTTINDQEMFFTDVGLLIDFLETPA